MQCLFAFVLLPFDYGSRGGCLNGWQEFAFSDKTPNVEYLLEMLERKQW